MIEPKEEIKVDENEEVIKISTTKFVLLKADVMEITDDLEREFNSLKQRFHKK